ncbi:MAG: aldehyde dehydrogenase family protein [Verrucomicrobiales bacterium]|nr:aldehyde dehydrogenase family protein [Verrucomicrobiales bacterium]
MMSAKPANSPIQNLPEIVEEQRSYFASGKTRTVESRLKSLEKFCHELELRSDDLLRALSEDIGKPPIEAYLSEVYFLISEIKLYRKKLKKWAKPRRAGNPFYFLPARSEVRREAFGTALIVSAWNYPLQLAFAPAISAIGAGNTVLLKPSEMAPATGQIMGQIVSSSFDPGHFSVVQGGPELGQALLEQKFDAWFYTGSERVGRFYAEAAAKHLAPITLELGGKCPCIVDSDVDLKTAVNRIITGKFFNAGQTCMAPDYVLIAEALHDDFLKQAKIALTRLYPDPQSPDLARIVNDAHFERISSLIPETAFRLGDDYRAARYLSPSLIPNADPESACMREEIFGPVLPLVTYRNTEELFGFLKEKPSPLALYAFSKNSEFLEQVASAIPSGSVCFNDVIKQATNLDLPFGGVHESGMGRYRGRHGFETFSFERAVTKRGFSKDYFAVEPPYDGKLERMRKLLK